MFSVPRSVFYVQRSMLRVKCSAFCVPLSENSKSFYYKKKTL